MSLGDKAKDAWEWLKELFQRPPPPEPMPKPSNQPKSNESYDASKDNRYEVRDEAGNQVAEEDSLKGAHQQWQTLTDQKGRIIDRLTGQDVTPEPDENGRYVVVDKDGNQVGSFNELPAAITAWEGQTDKTGQIIDMKNKQDVTPRSEMYLSNQQMSNLQQMISRGAGHGLPESWLGIDPDLVAEMAEQINRLNIPAFDIANIAGKSKNVPTKTVQIKRRKVTIEKIKKPVDEPFSVVHKEVHHQKVPYPTDEVNIRPIRRAGEITQVNPSTFALPPEEFARRFANHNLPVREFEEEVTEAHEETKTHKVMREVEVPQVKEWTEEVEVSDTPSAQLLEIIIDVSGTMANTGINLAVALATVMIGKHVDDGSRYFYRQFADDVSGLRTSKTAAEKRDLIKFLIIQKVDGGVGGGTDIIRGVTIAADDVRHSAKGDDRPEVLLLTDGDDANVTASTVYDAVGEDITLHTVLVNPYSTSNALKQHSSTYYELYWDDNNVTGSDGSRPRRGNFDDPSW